MTVDLRTVAAGFTLLLGLAVPLADGPAEAAAPKARMIPIQIVGFECGDNCYLNYRPITPAGRVAPGEPKSALCSVGPCAAWLVQQELPRKYAGRRARIVLGKGKQYDAEGNVVGIGFPEIKQLVLDPVK